MTKRLIYMGYSLFTWGFQRSDDVDLCFRILRRAGNHLLHGLCPVSRVTKPTK